MYWALHLSAMTVQNTSISLSSGRLAVFTAASMILGPSDDVDAIWSSVLGTLLNEPPPLPPPGNAHRFVGSPETAMVSPDPYPLTQNSDSISIPSASGSVSASARGSVDVGAIAHDNGEYQSAIGGSIDAGFEIRSGSTGRARTSAGGGA
ncbi:hypothetical protein DFH08DRAFT_966332 [Mycena albidolilacea]|uniref:Uncharacterized protein n=1 Tax=Mycena albidolilacea TaxID=1033008 RepID=A0AAD6ZNQ9_9AGAR|nr:hypothetical protein DFH08DRAFT_966332 [Mycena albidolilacea]